MSGTAVALAALFVSGMMGLGLALFVKGAREKPDSTPHWPHGRRRG